MTISSNTTAFLMSHHHWTDDNPSSIPYVNRSFPIKTFYNDEGTYDVIPCQGIFYVYYYPVNTVTPAMINQAVNTRNCFELNDGKAIKTIQEAINICSEHWSNI